MTDQPAGSTGEGEERPRRPNLIDVGRIATVFGVKGWVKIQTGTEPPENIFSYTPWWLKTRHGVKPVEVVDYRPHGKGWVAQLKGVDDREQAEALAQVTIAVERGQMPALETGDYYWHQLIGLSVVSHHGGSEQLLGVVDRLLETGANDVLVVRPCAGSLDRRERLIPYLPGQFVTAVDLAVGELRVDWDPEF